ncbi:hypothetical protein [Pseudomonas putida]|jgi:hypothetical protein|uniref:hypothetical protein n=1 Tax=Pseudomonas putida TaxID=303 RepID=UPI003D990F5D
MMVSSERVQQKGSASYFERHAVHREFQFSTDHLISVGAAAGCDLLIFYSQIKRSSERGPSLRQLLQGNGAGSILADLLRGHGPLLAISSGLIDYRERGRV